MNVSEQVAAHIAGADFGALDTRTIDRVKARLLDSIGNAMIGRMGAGNAAALDVVLGKGGVGQATVLGTGRRAPAAEAAFLNALMQRSFDFEACEAEDVDGKPVPGHISGSTVPAALAIAERERADGRALLLALAVGDDLADRLSVAARFDLADGSDNTGTSNGPACAALAAKLLGLGAESTLHAMGIVLNQLSGTLVNIWDGAMAFKLPQALSARNGIDAADLAARGFTGPADPLAGRFGFLDQFGGSAADPGAIIDRLGTRFLGDKVIKPWSCCRIVQGPIEAVLGLREALDPDAIVSIELHIDPVVLGTFTAVPYDATTMSETAALFSLRTTVALALRFGDVRPEHMSPELTTSPAIQDLVGRMTLVPDATQARFGVTARVTTADGRTLERQVATALGDIYANPLDDAALLRKYDLNMRLGGVSEANADRVRALVVDLESVDDVTELLRPLAVADDTAWAARQRELVASVA